MTEPAPVEICVIVKRGDSLFVTMKDYIALKYCDWQNTDSDNFRDYLDLIMLEEAGVRWEPRVGGWRFTVCDSEKWTWFLLKHE
jgi:hypothetical protein